MPELPEVETVKLGLNKFLPGLEVADVWHDWQKSFPNSPSDVAKFLMSAKITRVKRRAKVLLIELSTGYSLVVHLKMTGQLVFVGKQRFGAGHPTDSLINNLPDKSTRVIISFFKDDTNEPLELSSRKKRGAQQGVHGVQRASTGASDNEISQELKQRFGLAPKAGLSGGHLYFNDQRKFGWMRLIPTSQVPEIDFFKKVGPEPLDAAFTASKFIECLKRRKNSGIKAVLLDQTILAGVGNIYADESLFMARIHPESRVYEISRTKLVTLHSDLLAVLKLAIKKGGSTDRNYVNAEGKRGSYIDFAQVFRREGEACQRCGTEIIKIRVAGRGTHICPKCQKKP